MERYGRDFEWDRWSATGDRQGWRRQDYGGDFGPGGGAFQGRHGGRENEYDEQWRGGGYGGFGRRGDFGGGFGAGGWQGGGGEGGGRGDFGRYGADFGGRGGGYDADFGGGRRYGGEFLGAYGGAGYQGGYGGYTDFLDEQRGGYRGGYERERGGGRRGQSDSAQVRAAEIMTENPETVTPDATLADAARKMRDLNVGIIPVVDSDDDRRLRGVITDRDIAIRAVAEGKDPKKTTVSEVMTTDIETCNKNDSVRDIMSVMQREQVRRVPITDRDGRLVGIVAQADVAVDFLEERPRAKREVARTLRRVSEPAEPEGRTGGMRGPGRGGGAERAVGGQGEARRGREPQGGDGSASA